METRFIIFLLNNTDAWKRDVYSQVLKFEGQVTVGFVVYYEIWNPIVAQWLTHSLLNWDVGGSNPFEVVYQDVRLESLTIQFWWAFDLISW